MMIKADTIREARLLQYIHEHTSELALMTQLAEECSELCQAALKLARAEGLVDNPTDKNLMECFRQLREEAGDVYLCMTMLGILPVLPPMDKVQRWADRLGWEEDA